MDLQSDMPGGGEDRRISPLDELIRQLYQEIERLESRVCYCEIGAGGKPCRDRAHCDKFYHNQRCRLNCRTEKENWTAGYVRALETCEPGSRMPDSTPQEEADHEWKRQQA